MSVSKLRAEAAKRDKAVAKHNESVTKHTKGTHVGLPSPSLGLRLARDFYWHAIQEITAHHAFLCMIQALNVPEHLWELEVGE